MSVPCALWSEEHELGWNDVHWTKLGSKPGLEVVGVSCVEEHD